MNKLLLATTNPGKLAEFQELLADLNIELVTPAQIGLDLDVVEDGAAYAENAAKKALAFAQASGLVSLADDSGLEVDALDGAPGLHSARYGSHLSLAQNSQDLGGAAGGRLSDGERRKYLLAKLQSFPRPWTARFHATIAIATPEEIWNQTARRLNLQEQAPRLQIFVGICEGEIIPEERGTGGFGYDPIFLLPELGKTMAELSMDEKNRLSHRARAVMKAKGMLKELFG